MAVLLELATYGAIIIISVIIMEGSVILLRRVLSSCGKGYSFWFWGGGVCLLWVYSNHVAIVSKSSVYFWGFKLYIFGVVAINFT